MLINILAVAIVIIILESVGKGWVNGEDFLHQDEVGKSREFVLADSG